jgi:hypothetical protein
MRRRYKRARRDAGPGYDLVRYANGRTFVAPASGSPDYASRRQAEHAAQRANTEWSRRGSPTLSQEMGHFFAPTSRDGRDAKRPRRFRSKRAQQAFISQKIRILRHEGYPPGQAVAIALRMGGVPPRPQDVRQRKKTKKTRRSR